MKTYLHSGNAGDIIYISKFSRLNRLCIISNSNSSLFKSCW